MLNIKNGEYKKNYFILFLVLIFYILLFANDESYGVQVQYISVGGVILFSLLSVFFRKKLYLCKSNFEKFMIFMLLQSLFSGGLLLINIGNDALYSLYFSLLLMTVFCFISLMVANINIEDLMRLYCYSVVCMVITVLIFNLDEYFTSLSIYNSDTRWMLRFRPFNMHPNLTGYVFGGSGLLLAYRALFSRLLLSKLIYGFIALASFSIVFAASARASLLSVFLSSVITLLIFSGFLNKKFFALLSAVSVTVIIFFASRSGNLYRYASDVLELESDTRGVDSGGSGRTELWQRGVDLFLSDTTRFLIGGGVRSSSPEIIGFSTESSYITILLESGFFTGSIYIIFILSMLFRVSTYTKNSTSSEDFWFGLSLYHVLLFSLIQSVFNRYLLAIGNPFSLLGLILMIYISRGMISRRGLCD